MKRIALIIASIVCSSGYGATLSADALLCEQDAELQIPIRDKWATVGGAQVMKMADSSAQFARLVIQANQGLGDLALREEHIRSNSRLRGSSTVRASNAQAEQQAAGNQLAVYEKMLASCAASGSAPLAAEVIEQRAISGVAKVRITFRGSTAELWTYTKHLTN